MAITVSASPANLAWTNFTVSPTQIPDPADGTLVDAYTTFDYTFPNSAPLNRRFHDPRSLCHLDRAPGAGLVRRFADSSAALSRTMALRCCHHHGPRSLPRTRQAERDQSGGFASEDTDRRTAAFPQACRNTPETVRPRYKSRHQRTLPEDLEGPDDRYPRQRQCRYDGRFLVVGTQYSVRSPASLVY